MQIYASYYTDVGNVKKVNQDSFSLKVVNSPQGRIVLAMICDGMGGLEHGELASKEVVIGFNNWFATDFAKMVKNNEFSEQIAFEQLEEIANALNERLSNYAVQEGKMMGTTISLLLIYKGNYYIFHIGDSCIFRIDEDVQKITEDHTLVAEEVKMGKITKEEAKVDARKHILLQCIGASKVIIPQFESGVITRDITFLLSSDGFVHNISYEELFNRFHPNRLTEKDKITQECEDTTKLVLSRGEKDNVTVIGIVIKLDENELKLEGK